MKKRSCTFAIALCSLLFLQCDLKKSTPETAAAEATDSLPTDQTSVVDTKETQGSYRDIVAFSGTASDSIFVALATYAPLTPVLNLSLRAIAVEDSLEATGFIDTLITAPYETRAYQAILAYKKTMAAGAPQEKQVPSLLELTRTVELEDSTINLLPLAGNSTVLADGKFFFLGGAPFLSKIEPEGNIEYTDTKGNREVRFVTTVTDNSNYLLTACPLLRKERINISYGPPLRSYEMGPQQIRGIGSLRHDFVNNIPVTFLTSRGVVQGRLVAITIKLVPESLGCVSDQPSIEFACTQNLDESDILAIYIPNNSTTITCAINRPDRSVWTADINNDGIADIACVSGTAEGISDIISEVLWFVNVRGTWQIIDAGIELDCT